MDLSDIQGLVFHPYRRLPHASYVLLRFERNAAAVQRWLATYVAHHRIDSASPKDVGPVGSPDVRLNIAFTYSGLAALGLDRETLATFPSAFVEGLGAPWRHGEPDHRSRILGDVGASSPDQWAWGYQDDERRVDAMLLAFARDPVKLDVQVDAWVREAEACGAIAPGTAVILWGQFPDDPTAPVREPFGFVDGVSQPVLRGAAEQLKHRGKAAQPSAHEVEDGEMLLGHRDGVGQISRGPSARLRPDEGGLLPLAHDSHDRYDLGFNGSYMVFRQLAQHVERFENACLIGAAAAGVSPAHFAALLVGRWQDGSPLVKAPLAADPSLRTAPAANDFTFHRDPHGERCPIGAHIRRANPRDSLGDNPDESLRVVNRHRILRRGRPYRSGHEEGIHFICLNADIVRQFEFIQQNWINDATFGGLGLEDDPLVGPRQGHAATGMMTLPPTADCPVQQRVSGLQRYVTVKGGGYFFLPSLTALRYLAKMPPAAPVAASWTAPVVKATRGDHLRVLALSRFAILFTAILAAAPLALLADTRVEIVRPLFHFLRARDLAIVTMLASLVASGALLTFRLVQLYANVRFDVHVPPPPRLTWRRVLTWQAASLPLVLTALWLSATDAAVASSLWSELFRFARGVGAGYAAAFLLIFIAAAARERSVRPSNPEDALLLPPSRFLQRLKRAPTPVTGLAERIARFVESRMAITPRAFGAGYVNHENGQILPGHLTALTFVLLLVLLYVAGFFLLRPPSPRLGLQLPPLAYFLFLLLTAGLAASGISFFLDRFRVPLLTALAAWLVVAQVTGGTDHRFAVDAANVGSPPTIAAAIENADYRQPQIGIGAPPPPIVIVTAGGGGVHQAAWTARVLAGLTELWGSSFSGNLRMVSAVSAGSVGTMHFVNAYTQGGLRQEMLRPIVDGAKTPVTGDLWWGFAYPDLLRVLLAFPPTRLIPTTTDRGWALEQGWHRALGLDVDAAPPTMSTWQSDVAAGWRPAVAFNATLVETGQRAVLATYELPRPTSALSLGEITSGRDLSVITAARLSAAFPFVTPFARADNSDGDKRLHVADGGYWDNYGVVSAIEWLKAAAPALAGRQVLVIQIPPAPMRSTDAEDQAWVWQVTAPLETLLSVRTNAQAALNARLVDELAAAPPASLDVVSLPYPGAGESLGWHLTRRESCDIERAWHSQYATRGSRPQLQKIAAVLGAPTGTGGGVPQECAR